MILRTSGRNLSEEEIEKRIEIAQREITEYAPEYDHRITNQDGHLSETVNEIITTLEKEGFVLQK
jgi:guanylate kinase